jgi:hypothetical protein
MSTSLLTFDNIRAILQLREADTTIDELIENEFGQSVSIFPELILLHSSVAFGTKCATLATLLLSDYVLSGARDAVELRLGIVATALQYMCSIVTPVFDTGETVGRDIAKLAERKFGRRFLERNESFSCLSWHDQQSATGRFTFLTLGGFEREQRHLSMAPGTDSQGWIQAFASQPVGDGHEMVERHAASILGSPRRHAELMAVLADVSGKGPSAALFMAVWKFLAAA